MDMSIFAQTIFRDKYSQVKADGTKETWADIADRVSRKVMESTATEEEIQEVKRLIAERKFMPGGRFLYSAGRQLNQVNNCFLLRAQDSREGWADLLRKAALITMCGGGVGVNYTRIRPEGKLIHGSGGYSTGPCALMQAVNEVGRGIMGGGSRRAAMWAGLSWTHSDINRFVHMKDWLKEVRMLKAKDFSFPATMDLTNISVCVNDEFFTAYNDQDHKLNSLAHSTYWNSIRRALKTGEPGFSIDTGLNRYEDLRNPCTELTSYDDSDVCCLGSINLARIGSLEEMKHVVNMAVAFLMCGTMYSSVPYPEISAIREKNRRLGLGLMGIHEWLLMHGKPYGQDADLQKYMEVYAQSTEMSHKWADQWDLSRPVKTRAIAPTGTIAIVAETTTGIEPIFCVAYKRRYLKNNAWHYQYVIDPTAKKLVDAGIHPSNIEDAYTLAGDIDRRLSFQVWLQSYVDHAISSTVNLPRWGSEQNNEDTVTEIGNKILKYMPGLRGLTVYPEGARDGQPLVPINYNTAQDHIGETFIEAVNMCSVTRGEPCGD
jgi:ribonucleoside-diphosphate reductase alpha chain